MRKFPIIAFFVIAIVTLMSCKDDNNLDDYKEWRSLNNNWLSELELSSGSYYRKVIPSYDKGQYVLMHWFNDRNTTAGNLQPYYTSTVAVKYIGRLYNDEAFDSSYLATDSLFVTKVNAVIPGWTIALQEMHVGDSVEVVIPYQSAYGTTGSGKILPFSNLKFNIKLVDIPNWETK
ncbi:MAG: FKBP-type peptidyl-prolyl cis-trans isomerase [Muribaculum sp.]